MIPRPPISTLFPYTTLFRSELVPHPPVPGGGVIARPAALEGVREQVRREHGEVRSEEHTSELQSLRHLVCRLLLEKKKKTTKTLDTNDHILIDMLARKQQ